MECQFSAVSTVIGCGMRDAGCGICDMGFGLRRERDVCERRAVHSCIVLIFSSLSSSALPRASEPASQRQCFCGGGEKVARLCVFHFARSSRRFCFWSTMTMLRCWFILDRSIDAIVAFIAFIAFIRYSKTRKLVTEHPCVVFRLCLSYDKFDLINDGETLIHQVL